MDESTVHPDEGCATSLTYDRVHSRWLRACVPWRNDGTIYLCNGMVVNADGSSYLVPRFTPYSYAVIGVEPEGLYLIFGEPPRWQSQGLMFVTYSGQETRMVTNYGFWNVAAFGFAYGTVTSSVPDGAANVVRRVDLKTGKTEDWFERRRLVSNVIGFTQTGTPIVFAGNSTKGEVWLAGHEPQLLYEADTSIDSFVATTAIGDDVGIWVETNRGLYLYTASAGWEFASGLSGRVASTFITSH